MPKTIKANINKLYLINALSSTQFQGVVAALFLLSKGFTFTQLFLFGSVYAVGAMLSEIPTGMFSDKIGRRASLILSTLIELPAVIVVILSHSFLLIALMNLIFGIAASFSSGTDTAILYDSLKEANREGEFKKINGQLKWLGSWGGAIGGIVGGLLAKYSLAYAWWAWVAALILVLIVKLSLIEPSVKDEPSKKLSIYKHLSNSLKLSLKGDASYYIYYYVFIWLFFWIGYTLWQPYLKLSGLPLAYFGFFYAGISLISGIISKQSHKIETRLGMRTSLLLIPLMLALAFVLQAKYVFILSFLFIAIQAVASGFFSPILEDYVNKRIASDVRATVLSVQNMLSRLVFLIVSPLIGHMVDLYSLRIAYMLMGIILIVLAVLFFWAYRLRPKSEKLPAG